MSKFIIESTTLKAIDPCHIGPRYVSQDIHNVVPGVWEYKVNKVEDELFMRPFPRIAELIVWNTEKVNDVDAIINWTESEDVYVCVDSGQAGFFDSSKYPTVENEEYEKWYNDIFEQMKEEVRVPIPEREIIWKLEYFRNLRNYSPYSDMSVEEFEEIVEEYHSVLKDDTVIDWRYDNIANVGYGVASKSGYGDGGYSVYLSYDNDKVVAAKIIFIGDEDDE